MPNITLWNNQTKAPEQVPAEAVRDALASGNYVEFSPGLPSVGGATESLDSTRPNNPLDRIILGEAPVVDYAAQAQALADEQREEAFGGIRGEVQAFGEGVLGAATLGIYEGGQDLRSKAFREQNPVAGGLGQFVGTVGTMGASASPLGILNKGAMATRAATTAALGGGRLAGVAGAAAEGALFGAVAEGINMASDTVLRNKPFVAEHLASAAGMGALLGVGFEGLTQGVKAVARYKPGAKEVATATASPQDATEFAESVTSVLNTLDSTVDYHNRQLAVLRGFRDDANAGVASVSATREGQFIGALDDAWFEARESAVAAYDAARQKVARYKPDELLGLDTRGYRQFADDMAELERAANEVETLLRTSPKPKVEVLQSLEKVNELSRPAPTTEVERWNVLNDLMKRPRHQDYPAYRSALDTIQAEAASRASILGQRREQLQSINLLKSSREQLVGDIASTNAQLADVARKQKRLATVDESIADLESRIAEIDARPRPAPVKRAELTRKIEAFKREARPLRDDVASATSLEQRLTDKTSALTDVDKSLARLKHIDPEAEMQSINREANELDGVMRRASKARRAISELLQAERAANRLSKVGADYAMPVPTTFNDAADLVKTVMSAQKLYAADRPALEAAVDLLLEQPTLRTAVGNGTRTFEELAEDAIAAIQKMEEMAAPAAAASTSSAATAVGIGKKAKGGVSGKPVEPTNLQVISEPYRPGQGPEGSWQTVTDSRVPAIRRFLDDWDMRGGTSPALNPAPESMQPFALSSVQGKLRESAGRLAAMYPAAGGIPGLQARLGVDDLVGKHSSLLDALTDAWSGNQYTKLVNKLARGGDVTEATASRWDWTSENMPGPIRERLAAEAAAEAAAKASKEKSQLVQMFFNVPGAGVFNTVGRRLGRIAGWAGEKMVRAAAAVESALSNGRAAGAVKLTGALRASYTGNEDDATDNVIERVIQLQHLMQDPERAARRLDASVQPIVQDDPTLALAIKDATMRRLKNLSLKAPSFIMTPGMVPPKPFGPAWDYFEKYEAVTHDPDLVIAAVKGGNLTRAIADASREQHPAQHDLLVKQMLEQLTPERMRTMTPQQRAQAELLLGFPLRPPSPSSQPLYKRMREKANQVAGGAPNPRGLPQPTMAQQTQAPPRP